MKALALHFSLPQRRQNLGSLPYREEEFKIMSLWIQTYLSGFEGGI
jgi:hypothetical protein